MKIRTAYTPGGCHVHDPVDPSTKSTINLDTDRDRKRTESIERFIDAKTTFPAQKFSKVQKHSAKADVAAQKYSTKGIAAQKYSTKLNFASQKQSTYIEARYSTEANFAAQKYSTKANFGGHSREFKEGKKNPKHQEEKEGVERKEKEEIMAAARKDANENRENQEEKGKRESMCQCQCPGSNANARRDGSKLYAENDGFICTDGTIGGTSVVADLDGGVLLAGVGGLALLGLLAFFLFTGKSKCELECEDPRALARAAAPNEGESFMRGGGWIRP